jgi:hypothetical protein
MPDTNVAKIRKVEPPAIYKTKRGKERLMGGRWNMLRVSEFLQSGKHWFTMDDLARFVYGSTSPTFRDNVRKHVPSQRRYMLDKDTPIITDYGPRGRIVRVKIYDQHKQEDQIKFTLEITRARDKKEISERRYDDLVRLFLLTDRISDANADQR